MRTFLLAAAGFALCVTAAAPAHAQKNIWIEGFSGDRKDVVKKAVSAELATAGHRFATTASPTEVDAVVSGRVFKKSSRWRAEVAIVNGADGTTLGEHTFVARRRSRLARAVRKNFNKRLGAAVESSQRRAVSADVPEAAPPPVVVDNRSAEPEPDPVAATAAGGPARLVIVAGLRFFNRDFDLNDVVAGNVQEYSLSGAPSLVIGADYMHFAGKRRGPLANIGASALLSFAVGLDSETPGGVDSFPTSSWQARFGGFYQFKPFRARARLELGTHRFSIDDADMIPKPEIPSVGYWFLRLAGQAEHNLHPVFAVSASLGFRLVLANGEIASDTFYPSAGSNAIDFEVAGRFRINRRYAIVAALGLERYFFSMDPAPADPNIAGGAVDQYLLATIGAQIEL